MPLRGKPGEKSFLRHMDRHPILIEEIANVEDKIASRVNSSCLIYGEPQRRKVFLRGGKARVGI